MDLRRWIRRARPAAPAPAPVKGPSLAPPRAVVPIVREASFFEGDGATRFREPIAGPLFVVYGVPQGGGFRSVTQSEASQMDVGALRETAFDNLRELLPQVEQSTTGALHVLTAGGRFEASLLLLDEVWEQMASEVSGELVAAVPGAGLIGFTGTSVRGGVRSLARWVETSRREAQQPLSDLLLLREGASWTSLPLGRRYA